MGTEAAVAQESLIELRQQAHYGRALHARAVEREAVWRKKAAELERVVRQQQAKITELTRQLEAARARIAWLAQQVFGRKSEQTRDRDTADGDALIPDDQDQGPDTSEPSGDRRPRGKQPGTKGHGRKRRDHLPTEEVVHDLPDDQRRCPQCGKPFPVFPGTEDSEVVEWEVRLVRRIHKRVRYRAACQCRAVPGIVTAPPPAKLIPKGLFGIGFWVRLLLEKYLFQRPLCRVRKVLALEGLRVSQGTLTGGLRRIGKLLQPIYTRILERSRTATHWKMDETRWMVFEEVEGKKGHRWWLWVVITIDTVVYLLEPTRSAQVPKNHLGDDAEGIINADRYSAYKALGGRIRIAFCWSHVRRDFIRIGEGYKTLRRWSEAWLKRINELFGLNDQRLAVPSNREAFQAKDRALREAIAAMAEQRDRELANPTLHPAARKALKSLQNHWDGCTLFVDHPEIPMDNNESEQRMREPALGRKNYYGSGSVWSGMLTAMVFTICQTLLKNGIDPQAWLVAYFEACAQNGGHPPENIDAFLPWNLSEEQKDAWALPEPFP
ncbi:MAG: IS66 family transposase [Planctomycetota bacterium]|jgi:transposase